MNPSTIPDLINAGALFACEPSAAAAEINALHRERMNEVVKELAELREWKRQQLEVEPGITRLLTALQRIADLAHAGGLANLSARDALSYIRTLTVEWFNTNRTNEVLRSDVEQVKHELNRKSTL